MRRVTVKAVQGGWMVEGGPTEAMVYRSGSMAERKANELGRLLAFSGQVEIVIHDLRGLIAGSRVMDCRSTGLPWLQTPA